MKKLLLSSTIALVSHSALAADMPVKAPLFAPNLSWTGFYVGGNVGYGIGTDPSTLSTISASGFPVLGAGTTLYGGDKGFTLAPHGWNGGLQAGYNWQLARNWVVGAEADIQWSDMKNGVHCLMPCNAQVSTVNTLSLFPVVFNEISADHKLNWFGTLRGRFGYTASPALFYVTGGLAYGEVQRSGAVSGRTSLAAGGATIKTRWIS